MNSPLSFRRASASDAKALSSLAMRSKALWGYDEAFMDLCVEELTVTPDMIASREVWIAASDAEAASPIGFYTLILPDQPSEQADLGELFLFFAEPAAKGTGVGGKMWRHMEAQLLAHDLKGVAFDADPFAEGFYQHMGAKIVGRSPSGSIPGRTLARMEKHLSKAVDTNEMGTSHLP